MTLSQGIQFVRNLVGIRTETPPWAVTAFSLMSENGVGSVYVDPNTGALKAWPLAGQTFGNLILNSQSPTTQVVTSGSGAVTIQNSTVVITKTGSLAALTLAVPTTAQNGLRICFTSTTAFAHTVTCPSAIINRGVTGDPVTVGTLAAFPGAGFTVEAYAGKWNVVANVVTSFA